ncbi:MAG: hypothetical protein QNJ53_22250 [Pleurocapsa sp. MO_192.B19]|nr:hypothetical protein [Pleurocapsa sp. MO_192.B19]
MSRKLSKVRSRSLGEAQSRLLHLIKKAEVNSRLNQKTNHPAGVRATH